MNKSPNEEVGLKEILVKYQEWKRFFISRWKTIVILGLLGGGGGLLKAYMDKPLYTGSLTFVLEEKSGGMSAYAGIANQFGLNIGGAGSDGAFSGDNLLKLLKSRNLIEKTLLTEVNIEGKPQLLINRYIDFNELAESFKERPDLAAISFKSGDIRDHFGIPKDSILKAIYNAISKSSIEVGRVDKNLSMIEVKLKCEDELFSKYFIETLVKNVSDFYIETKTKKSRVNVDILQNKVDSVKAELDKDMYGASVAKDQNLNLIRAQGGLSSVKKQLNVQILTTMYGELLKNLELSKFTLMREEPLIQVIDTPILPLDKQKFGKTKGLILGGFVGGFVALLYLVLARLRRQLLLEPSHQNPTD